MAAVAGAAVGVVARVAQEAAGACSTAALGACLGVVDGAGTWLMEAGPTSVETPGRAVVVARAAEDSQREGAEESVVVDEPAGAPLVWAV